ncbi:hypothetical protein ANMWB30_23810 [Arthrobacter sp. MWB30]|nr:hypothetical protein ANMWB30_23810 [Arthrobacter sp. MWB30]
MSIDRKKPVAMSNGDTGHPHGTVSGRVGRALAILATYGITPYDVQAKSELSDIKWVYITTSDSAELTGLSSLEAVFLAEALMLDVTYLLDGDRIYSVRFSPCTFEAMLLAEYPHAVVPASEHQQATPTLTEAGETP